MSRTTRRLMVRWVALAVAGVAAMVSLPVRTSAQPADEPAVAAAADLSAALPAVAREFTKRTGRKVRLVFGSSGMFTQQIQNGAPFQLFLSADERYVQSLVAERRTDGDGALYATGRIGVFLPKGSNIPADTALRGFVAAAKRGEIARFAIANPEHAPYGRAAMEALQHLGIWSALKPRLVLGENVAQATQFATSGSAAGGIIPLALALTPSVRAAGTFVLIGADRHGALRQRMVLVRGAGRTAREFYAFVQSAAAREIMAQYGFTLPDR